MKAAVGDRVRIKGDKVGMSDRIGEVLEVRGREGAPPYLVKFKDGHQSLIYPGPDCLIEPAEHTG